MITNVREGPAGDGGATPAPLVSHGGATTKGVRFATFKRSAYSGAPLRTVDPRWAMCPGLRFATVTTNVEGPRRSAGPFVTLNSTSQGG